MLGSRFFIFSGLINLQKYRLFTWQINWQYVPIRCQWNSLHMFHVEFLGNLRLCCRWSGGCEGHNLAHWGKTLQRLQCQKSRTKVWLSPWHNTGGLVYHNMFHIQSSEIILYQWLCKILRMPYHKSWRHGCGLVISFQTCDEVTINNSPQQIFSIVLRWLRQEGSRQRRNISHQWYITRVASWCPDRRKWLFSEVRGGIWTPHSPVLIKISADKRPLNQLTVKNLFFSLIIKTFCH